MVNKWFITFIDEVDEKQKKFLINLGLPIAGYKMEKCGDKYYFGKNFAIDTKNNLYYKDAIVTPRIWRNLAVLENFRRGVRTMLIREFGVEKPKFVAYDDLTVQYGRVLLYGVNYIEIGDWVDPFPGVHYNGKEYVFPRGTPSSMHLTISRDKSIEFYRGDLSYVISKSRDYGDFTIGIGLKNIAPVYETALSVDKTLPKKFYQIMDGIPNNSSYSDLQDLIMKSLDQKIKRRKGILEVGDVMVRYGKIYTIIDYKDKYEKEEVVENNSWHFVRFYDKSYYRKRVGAINLVYDPDFEELTIMAVNGKSIRVRAPIEVVSTMGVEDIIKFSGLF